jgi:hypothetical protein
MTEDAALGIGDNCDHYTVKSPDVCNCVFGAGLSREARRASRQ